MRQQIEAAVASMKVELPVSRDVIVQRVAFAISYCLEVINDKQPLDSAQLADVQALAAAHKISVGELLDVLTSDADQVAALFAHRYEIRPTRILRLYEASDEQVFAEPVDFIALEPDCDCVEAKCQLHGEHPYKGLVLD